MKKAFLLTLVLLMISGLAMAQTTKIIIGPRVGNDAGAITADTNEVLNVPVWIRTAMDIKIVGFHLPIGSNNTYIQADSRNDGDMFFPLPLWDDKSFLTPNDDNVHPGYKNQSILAIKDFGSDDPDTLNAIKTLGDWWQIAEFTMTTAGEGDGIPHDDAFIMGNQTDNGGMVWVDFYLGELDNDEIETAFATLELPMTTGVEDDDVFIPDTYSLAQNYPNPFNASTTIRYNLPEPGFVNIEIYDIMGRRIQTLVSQDQPAGSHSVVWNASNVSSGVYLYRIAAGDFVQTKRCNLIK